MKYALVNPNWSFEGSIYFGCREPHLPLEFGYSKALLERAGHAVEIIDGQLDDLSRENIRARVEAFAPDFTVITTAPSYLFWRCAPPELRIPQQAVADLRAAGGTLVIVGPHGSTTPATTLIKTGADIIIMGECEEILPMLATHTRADLDAVCYLDGDVLRVQGGPHASNMNALPALYWPRESVQRHSHHHHRFDAPPRGPGAEMEASRGCPYHCSFCAKDNFRNKYRKRPLDVILEELDGLIANGIEYLYFIDEIFLPNAELLNALVGRGIKFGIQTRIDLWSFEMLDLLGRAGCVSVEVGVESISEEGRALLDKNMKMSTEDLTARLIHAKRGIAFVQANLIDAKVDEVSAVDAWRNQLLAAGVWANKPVPLFPYPGSPDYTKLWGAPDEAAWERAHEYYLHNNVEFSDIQEQNIIPLAALELHGAYGR